jgi:hypothetical protein
MKKRKKKKKSPIRKCEDTKKKKKKKKKERKKERNPGKNMENHPRPARIDDKQILVAVGIKHDVFRFRFDGTFNLGVVIAA